jgi:hypothetical protein
MLFRQSMMDELMVHPDLVRGAAVIYSMWTSYLDRSPQRLDQWCKQNGVDFEIVHTSGHADPTTLKRLVTALTPTTVIPIHTEHPEHYASFSPSVKNAQRGLEIWMCTLGAGIVPKCRDDVRLIWSYLVGSMSSLPVAIQELRSIERRTTEMTGQASTEMFGNITTEQWMEFCR